MPRWVRGLEAVGLKLESGVDMLNYHLRHRTGLLRKVHIVPYRGFGTAERIYIHGRVLREKRNRPAQEKDRFWRNVLATYRRFQTVEIPRKTVRAHYGREIARYVTNNEGYFSGGLEGSPPSPADLWQPIEFELASESSSGKVASEVLVPTPGAAFGVISDIDDTVVVSHATSPLRMARAVFLQNAYSRVAFPGVTQFYQALTAGSGSKPANPIFYLSSGPWNLYDLLVDFFELKGLPKGPILLQDYGFERGKFFISSHHVHKAAQIELILRTYPTLPFVLIGDSGQKDPEIYSHVLERAGNRIRAVYIRDVANRGRRQEVRALAAKAREHGGQLVLFKKTAEAASHAARIQLIDPEVLLTPELKA